MVVGSRPPPSKNLLPPIPHALVHSQWQSVWYTYSVTLSAAGFNPTNSCSCRSYYYSGNTIVLFCPDTVFHATSTFFSASSHTTRVTHWHTEKNSKLQTLHYILCNKGQAKQSKKTETFSCNQVRNQENHNRSRRKKCNACMRTCIIPIIPCLVCEQRCNWL